MPQFVCSLSFIETFFDLFIQSTDKNLLVPVGGSIIASSDRISVERIGKIYPGRASGAPILDVFITLLSMGRVGYKTLLADRKAAFNHLKARLGQTAEAFGERLLVTNGGWRAAYFRFCWSIEVKLSNTNDAHALIAHIQVTRSL